MTVWHRFECFQKKVCLIFQKQARAPQDEILPIHPVFPMLCANRALALMHLPQKPTEKWLSGTISLFSLPKLLGIYCLAFISAGRNGNDLVQRYRGVYSAFPVACSRARSGEVTPTT
jgi:hypothetical protein